MANDAKEDDPQTADHKRQNKRALLCLLAGKLSGILGIILAFSTYRTLGGVLLFAAFVFVMAAITMTLGSFRKRKEEAQDDAAVLERMVREGTLKDHLREVEQKLRAERDAHTREIDEASSAK